MTNLREIETMSKKFNNLQELQKELKRVQSIKCRLKKQKGKKSYSDEMTEILKYEQILKEVRNLQNPKNKPVTQFDQKDIDQLDYDQTVKAIKSIQSKKTLTKWLTTEEGNNDEFRNACKIEEMLQARREKIRPVTEGHIRTTEIQTIIETIEDSGKLSQDKIIELLKSLV